MHGWMDGSFDGWMEGLVDGWIVGRVDGLLNEWMYVWCGRWMDG